jgi:transcriptional regulator with PAS, ATPase and Fis domain
MDRSPFLNQFAGGPSDALAIFEEGIIVYANNSFEKLYNPLQNAVRKRFDLELRHLNLDLQQSGKAFAQKLITLIPHDREVDIYVYLLNKSGSEKNCLLVLVDPANPPIKPSSFITEHEQLLDSNQILEKASKIKLSAAFSELVGEDPHFKAVLFKAQKAAKSDYPVLIEGESGTGKEILARTIHQTSRRSRKKFVDINCAAIPDQLIDSELFGYEKGAFTGATPGGRHGLFVEAHQGTLFFDEVSDASLQTQAKLLRVLNEGCFKRIGSTKNIEVDVRIISATNKDLSQLIKERRFREDLIYRLNTISIYLPPLRDRPDDILLLANFFLKKHTKRQLRNLQFSTNCLDFLKRYHWPGNVRELKGVVDYMATMASGALITENHFPDFLLPAEHRNSDHSESRDRHFKADQGHVLLSTAIEHTEKEVIKEVLQKARTRSEAIEILGISRRTFYTKLKQYNLA